MILICLMLMIQCVTMFLQPYLALLRFPSCRKMKREGMTMKRLIALMLSLFLILSLCACGNTGSTAIPSESEAEKEELSAEDSAVSLRAGETVSLGFMEFTLNTAEALSQIPVLSERAEVGSYKTTNDDVQFVCVHGTIKNLSSSEILVNNISASITIDGSNTYSAEVNVYHGNGFNTKLAPLEDGKLYIFARVPVDVAENVESFCAEFSFYDQLKPEAEAAGESAYRYRISFSVDETAENVFTVNKFEPVELALGDEIITEFVEMRLDEVLVKDDLKVRYNGTTYSFSTDTSLKVLCFIGTIKNISKEEYNPCFTGKIVVDGYEYDIKDWELCKGLKVSPLVEAPLYIFAEIPESLASSFSSCTLTFGFDESFSNKFYSDITMLPYTYTLTFENNG